MFTSLLQALSGIVLAMCVGSPLSDFYVDVQNGSDTTGNGSSALPWKTISFAVTQLGSGTNRLLVRPGLYDSTSGESFPIVLRAGMTLESTDGAADTIVSGDPSSDVLRIEGADADCVIVGLTIENGDSGVAVLLDRAFAVIRNNTISGNALAGIKTGLVNQGTHTIAIQKNTITLNGTGLLGAGGGVTVGIESADNQFSSNSSDALSLSGVVFLVSRRDTMQNNGGRGLSQIIPPSANGFLQTSISNATISGNQAGGIYALADQFCFYVQYFGWICDDPENSIQAFACTIYGNGGDGVKRAGTSGSGSRFLAESIAWGNAGVDNVNFKDHICNIGTGSRTHAESFSLPPLLVNPQAGDLRIRKDSPCIDRSPGLAFTDFEGEVGGVDGNSDGIAAGDVGADEFHPFVAPGTRAVIGQPFWFFSEAPPADDGQLVFVMISTADGQKSGGIPVPGSQGQTVDLAPDWLFQLGLTLQPALTGTLQNGFAQTATVTLPNSTLFLGPVFYAGATIDLVAGQFKYVTPTHQFSIATQ
ncbi:MAG: right-handed parallel beta-helix repeat-containing protein [Planctomycetota bacterium]